MMMWQMSGGTCAALHSSPVKVNANPKSLHALVKGQGLQRATLTPPTINSYCKHTSNTTHNHQGKG